MFLFPGYQIEEELYKGRHSIVFRGKKKQDQSPVVLKLLRSENPTFLEINELKHEFEINKHIESDGVPKAYGLETYEDRTALILEDFGGKDMKGSGILHQFDTIVFLNIAIRLAEILGQIHHKNIIHKDINPGNIIINSETGVVKITDFGIASLLSRDNQEIISPEKMEPSLVYISPEQTGRMNRTIDYRTDLYSLGVTFYEMVTGTIPFQCIDPLEFIHNLMARTPPSPHQLNPEISKTISNIIMKLLAKNAEDRYQGAYGLKVDLEECLKRIEEDGEIRDFPIAGKDISETLRIPQKLYGREKEINELMQGFHRVTNGKSELMLVAGYSGVGKTVLIKELYKPITKSKGYFISGKFDQYKRNIPYSAIIKAFQGLVRMLLTVSEEQFREWKDKILKACGTNGQILIDVIPELEYIIGKQPQVPELPPTESQNRFNMVFQSFIGVFTQKEHPVSIFLDDLQWADSASLSLIKTLITNPESKYLYLLGAYRDNEVDSSHPLMLILDEIKKLNVEIFSLTLQPLALKHVNQLNATALGSELDVVMPFSSMVYKKTRGNPFFVNEFLKSLYQEKLLHFDFSKGGWSWELAKIEEKDITDNVVDLMIGKIRLLAPQTQNIISLASCIGNKFTLKILSMISNSTAFESLSNLWEAFQEGIIISQSEISRFIHKTEGERHKDEEEVLGKIEASFLHDRIQEAAYSLIPEVEREKNHLQIGRLLLKKSTAAEIDEYLFDIVNQLNIGRNIIDDPDEKIKLIQLNLQAGEKAKISTAYNSGAQYLAIGRELLPQNKWEGHYELTFDLFKESAECEYLLGNFEKANELLDTAFAQSISTFDKGQIYVIRIIQLAALGEYLEAVKLGVKALSVFDINMPSVEDNEAITQLFMADFNWYRNNWKGRKISELADLPINTDPKQNLIMEILCSLLDSATLGCPNYMGILTLKAVNQSIEHGNCYFSPFAYSFHALTLVVATKDYRSAYEFGEVGLAVNEKKIHNSAITSKQLNMFGAFVSHFQNHLMKGAEILQEGYKKGVESGDFVYAAYSQTNRLKVFISSGLDLPGCLEKIKEGLGLIFKLNNMPIYLTTQFYAGFILNLQGKTKDFMSLDFEDFNEAEYRKNFAGVPAFISFLDFYVMQSQYIFGNYKRALQYSFVEMTPIDVFLQGEEYRLYALLVLTALYENATKVDKVKYSEYIERYHAFIKNYAEICPQNFQSQESMASAEIARIHGKNAEAEKLYDQAIQSARDNGFIHYEAIANELASKLQLRLGNEDKSRSYMKEAKRCYADWGALGKVRDLKEKYHSLLLNNNH